jgi:MYXO-CTERM domain-containing protein
MRVAIATIAAAAAAGSAGASVTVLDPFTLPQASGTAELNQDDPDAPFYAYTGSYEAITGSPFGWRSVNTIITTTAATPGGFAPAGTASLESTSGGAASFSLYNANALFVYSASSTPGTAFVNMSSLLANGAAFQVQLSGLGEDNVGDLMVVLEDVNQNLAFYTEFDVTSDGLKAIAFESELAGFDPTAVKFMSLYVSSSVAFSGTLSNFTIPAPGALALLGAAGLVGARRRR